MITSGIGLDRQEGEIEPARCGTDLTIFTAVSRRLRAMMVAVDERDVDGLASGAYVRDSYPGQLPQPLACGSRCRTGGDLSRHRSPLSRQLVEDCVQ
jgi:hypothetical protein